MNKATGRYLDQPGGFQAFVPDPLPPADLQITGPLQTLLSKADRALGRLDGSVAVIPDADRFISMFVLREAVLSSQIEGTNASLMDVLEFEAQMRATSDSVDVREVVNYVNATNHGLARLETLPLTSRLIKEVHAILMDNVRGGEPSKTPGEFRRTQNWIGGATPASARFVPPPADEVGPTFRELEKFMNDEHPTLPPLVIAGLAHAQFETIHPFLDGNGRTGRLLITFWLIQNGILSAPVLYPSLYLKQEQEEYIRRLQNTRTDGGWEAWLAFFLDAVAAAAQEATSIALAIVELQKNNRALVGATFGRRTATALQLLDQLYRHPVIEPKFVEKLLGLSQPSVSSLLNEFTAQGILQETTGRARNRSYAYSSYLALFPGAEDRL